MYDSFISTFRNSFFKFSFYPRVLFWPSRRVFLYFLSVMAFFSFIAMWIQLPVWILGVTEATHWAVRDLPSMKIQDGQIRIQPPSKEKIYHFNLEENFGLLAKDFDLVINPFDPAKNNLNKDGIFFFKDRMMIRSDGFYREMEYAEEMDVTISSFTLMNWGEMLLWILPIYLMGRIFIGLALYKGMEVLFLAVMGFWGAKLLLKKTNLAICLRMAVMALPPSLIMAIAAAFLVPGIFSLGVSYYACFLICFILGLKQCFLLLDTLEHQVTLEESKQDESKTDENDIHGDSGSSR